MQNSVTEWFGENFIELDPLLQQLHQKGGVLSGQVNVTYGKGMAGFIGRRLASKLGLPSIPSKVDFSVTISHDKGSLHWDRQFNDQKMYSIFKPHGKYPSGCWQETTGVLMLELGVEIIDGGWYWKQKKVSCMDISLPQTLMPKTNAYKKVVNGKYFFYVGISLPLLGEVLSYSGDLSANVD